MTFRSCGWKGFCEDCLLAVSAASTVLVPRQGGRICPPVLLEQEELARDGG